MQVLITGGAGFIGQHLARLLSARGHQVVALDALLPQVHADPAASRAAFPGPLIEADIAEAGAWLDLPAVDAVVHLAAETGTGQSMYERDRYARVNVTGTEHAAALAAQHAIPLVSLSSRAVYGEGRHECREHGTTFGPPCCPQAVAAASHEDDPHAPVSVYGATKADAEAAAQARLAGSGRLTIIRPQNVIGPGQSLHNPYTGVLAAFLAMLREGRPLTIYGAGDQTRDFLHVSDLTELISWTLDNPPDPGSPRVLNAGTGVRVSLLQVARAAIVGARGGDPGVVHLEVHRAGDIDDACADLARLQALGAPLPRWSAEEAIADFIRASWDEPGAPARAWDLALDELRDRGLTT